MLSLGRTFGLAITTGKFKSCRRATPADLIFNRFAFLLAVLFCGAIPSRAEDPANLTKHGQHGDWRLICSTAEKERRCAIAAAYESDTDSGAWTRIGLEINFGEPILAIRTPPIERFARGVALTIDGKQLGRIFVDSCVPNRGCEFRSSLTFHSLGKLVNGQTLTVEYPTSDSEGVRIFASLNGFREAVAQLYESENRHPQAGWLAYLRKMAPFRGGTDIPMQVSLKSVSEEAGGTRNNRVCSGEKGTVTVHLDSSELVVRKKDAEELKQWVAHAKANMCFGENTVWVMSKPDTQGFNNSPNEKGGDVILDVIAKTNVSEQLMAFGVPDDKVVLTSSGNDLAIMPHVRGP